MPGLTPFEEQLLQSITDDRWRTNLAEIRHAMEDIWAAGAPRIIHDYTDHGAKHSERLAKLAVKLLEANTGQPLSMQEMYLLLAGIYLHDIGMQCDVVHFPEVKARAEEQGARFEIEFTAQTSSGYSIDEQKAIRKNHHYLSAAWIEYAHKTGVSPLGRGAQAIPDYLVEDLMNVCKYHAKLPITECPAAFQLYPKERKQFVAALLRFADELDVDVHRVTSIAIVKGFRLNPRNAVYWWLHNHTNVAFSARNMVLLTVRLHPDDMEHRSFVHDVFIGNFKSKNQYVLGVLAQNGVPILIDPESKVVPHRHTQQLPLEIVGALQVMQEEGNVLAQPTLRFTNRLDEIRELTSSYAPAYYLVDAPARYGKTELLKEVQRRFREKNWKCVYVSIEELRSLPAIIQELATGLEILPSAISNVTTQTNARDMGCSFGEVIKGHWGEEKGFVLLIDVESLWSSLEPLVKGLLTEFIPSLEQAFRDLEPFRDNASHNPFRVILAGRYLRYRVSQISHSLPFNTLELTPFSYQAVKDATEAFLGQNGTGQIVAHLMHYTAGHPGCIARVLKMYKDQGQPPDEFFSNSAVEILDKIVCPEAEDVRRNISVKLRRYVDDLSVFRCLEPAILGKWFCELHVADYEREFEDAYELEKALLENDLMSVVEEAPDMVRDNITRRLLAIRLVREGGFAGRCQQAQRICQEYLQEDSAQRPYLWAIESLFQFLQGRMGDVQDASQRADAKRSFFENIVPEVLKLLLVGSLDPRNRYNAVMRTLERDWEFQFVVNYFLREDVCNTEPCESLKQAIESFFANEIEKRGES